MEETHFFNAHCVASVANVGLCLLARNQECASLTTLVASLKAEVVELHGQLKQSNRHIEALEKKNRDFAELVEHGIRAAILELLTLVSNPAAAMGVDDFFNPHGDTDFDPEPDPESGSSFDDPDPDYDDDDDPDPDSDDDPDPDSDDDPEPEFVSDSNPDPDFDSDFSPDSGPDSDPNSYSTCILCIFRCTDYDF
ncbi:hypothetical protein L3X38_008645 [Prunus dulcis]|uniref:Uncharacterized protein n=1 Tax=Prunus dulcis TaxID=3755 RepID=A0AAD4ZWT0_PRUDU|nr:hypothetical protein L3X38_008645 [Prunus dulcis]